MYHGGAAGFWEDWTEFTGTPHPVLVQRDPRLVLVARTFDGRTAEALDFLLQHSLPVQVLKVAFCVDDGGRRFLDVEWESEPESVPHAVVTKLTPAGPGQVGDALDFREITLAEVTAAVPTPCALTWARTPTARSGSCPSFSTATRTDFVLITAASSFGTSSMR
jgi:hypothetical protein